MHNCTWSIKTIFNNIIILLLLVGNNFLISVFRINYLYLLLMGRTFNPLLRLYWSIRLGCELALCAFATPTSPPPTRPFSQQITRSRALSTLNLVWGRSGSLHNSPPPSPMLNLTWISPMTPDSVDQMNRKGQIRLRPILICAVFHLQ